jgi:hypothetical protein
MALVPVQSVVGETKEEHAARYEDCRTAVAAVLRHLRKYDPVPIGKVRRQVENYANKLRRARTALHGAGGGFWLALPLSQQARKLDELQQQVNDLLNGPFKNPFKTSTASNHGLLTKDMIWRSFGKHDALRARCAATDAFFLLQDLWGIAPTATQHGHWHKMTDFLYTTAFGPEQGDTLQPDTLRACRQVRKRVQEARLRSKDGVVRWMKRLVWKTPTPLVELEWNDEWTRLYRETRGLVV